MHFASKFKRRIKAIHGYLDRVTPELAAYRPAPNKWSTIEIMGHLVDSANNNHRRFTKAQWQDTMIFNGYEQEKWVKAQNYQNAKWYEIVDLWRLYNLHICFLMKNTPTAKLNRAVKNHNLHQIAMKTIPADQPVTLAYFMEDYIYHIEHHFKQIKAIVKEAKSKLN